MPFKKDSDGLVRYFPAKADPDGFTPSSPLAELGQEDDGFIAGDRVQSLAEKTGLSPSKFIAATFRYGLPIAGGVGAGFLTANPIAGVAAGAALGGAGEAAAQLVEHASGTRPEGQNLREIGTAAAVSALPFGRATQALRASRFAQGVTSKAAATLSGAVEGGLFGATSAGLKASIEEGRLPTLSEVGIGAAGGALLGGVFGRITEPRNVPITQAQIAAEGLEAIAKRSAKDIAPLQSATIENMLAEASKGVKEVPADQAQRTVSREFLKQMTEKIQDIPHWQQLLRNTDAAKTLMPEGQPWTGYAAMELARKSGILPAEVEQEMLAKLGTKSLEETINYLGSGLSQFSKLSTKGVAKSVDPDILTPSSKRGLSSGFLKGWQEADKWRRGLLTAQLGGRVVDAITTTGRAGVDFVDITMQNLLRGQPKFFKTMGQNTLTRTADVLTRRNSKAFAGIAEQFPEIRQRLLDTPGMQEVTPVGKVGQKVVDYAHILGNAGFGRMFETWGRKVNYNSALADGLMRMGVDPDNLRATMRQLEVDAKPLIAQDPRYLEVLQNSAEHALENSFAASPSSDWGKLWMKTFSNNPVMTAVAPFPRFIANSTKFLTDFNPIGIFKLLARQGDGELLASDPRAVEQVLSRATIGTVMLSTALAARYSDTAGQKWHEFKLPNGQVVDLQFFAPFSAYLFLGEAIKQMATHGNLGRMTTEDILTGALSFNRVSGMGSFLFDFLQGRTDADTLPAKLEEALGEYIGGFTVPFRTFKDFLSLPLPEEGEVKDVRDSPLTGKFWANVPFATRGVPSRADPLTGLPKQSGGPSVDPLGLLGREVPPNVIKQLTGARIREGNPVEEAVVGAGKEPFEYTPKLKADRESALQVGADVQGLQRRTEQIKGALTAKKVGDLIASERFQLMDQADKSATLGQLMSLIAKQADRQALMEAKRKDPRIEDKLRVANQGNKLPSGRREQLLLERSKRRLGADLQTR